MKIFLKAVLVEYTTVFARCNSSATNHIYFTFLLIMFESTQHQVGSFCFSLLHFRQQFLSFHFRAVWQTLSGLLKPELCNPSQWASSPNSFFFSLPLSQATLSLSGNVVKMPADHQCNGLCRSGKFLRGCLLIFILLGNELKPVGCLELQQRCIQHGLENSWLWCLEQIHTLYVIWSKWAKTVM